MNQTSFTFVDLFAGIGGFRLALNRLGGTCLNFSEIDSNAINTYCDNFQEDKEFNLGDIRKIKELPAANMITAGVPCQSWSIAGKNLGFDDDRGQLWNDTIFLLNQSKPDTFIFENVKGLADPRNRKALDYILERIREAGYSANVYVLNSFDYGVPQNRVRIYIVGFRLKYYFSKFKMSAPVDRRTKLAEIMGVSNVPTSQEKPFQRDLFGDIVQPKVMSLSASNGFNDYFLFNDLRNGHSTIHSWDILDTTDRQKNICYLLLKNRRKKNYGSLDGNPLSLIHFQNLDSTITQSDIDELVSIGIFTREQYAYRIERGRIKALSPSEETLIELLVGDHFVIDKIKNSRESRLNRVNIPRTIQELEAKGVLFCDEVRYDFKNTKISTGLFGVNRIFLPSSDIFPTLVASDTNDFIATRTITATTKQEYKELFLKEIYKPGNYRRISRAEACLIQGFPNDYRLPESRMKWMKLLGNSVSVPVISAIGKAIIETGVFDGCHQK